MNSDEIDIEIRKAILHDIKEKPFMKKHRDKDLLDNSDAEASNLSRHNTPLYHSLLRVCSDRFNKSLVKNKNYNEQDRKRFIGYIEKEYINSLDNTSLLHTKLLQDNILSNFNETPPMPFTSLKYHTLLVCAIYYNHLKYNRRFDELYLNYTNTPEDPYTVIFKYNNHNLVINNKKNGGRIGFIPTHNFGDTIGRLVCSHSELLFTQYIVENLRRFRSWSVGLQYLEDVNLK